MDLQLKSREFSDRAPIPPKYTGEGDDISPPLEWTDAPRETKQFVLICDDPDAPGLDPYVHWILYNIPPSKTSLPEDLEGIGSDVGTFGKNSFGKVGYNGPLPPPGDKPHNYEFKLYALNQELSLPPGLEKNEVLKAIEGKIIGEAELDGTFKR